ncbi:MAG: hypothetical protein PVSMB4_19660 [Ktedonobacterales bacterium]
MMRIWQLVCGGALIVTLALGSGVVHRPVHPTAPTALGAHMATRQLVAATQNPTCASPFPCY